MAQPRHIHDLADELLSEVLSFLLESRLRTYPGLRALNGDSYGNGVGNGPHDYGIDRPSSGFGFGEASDLDRFRLVCTRFMRIGTPRKFSHFNLRFSEHGFQRLNELLQMQLACYVKSMTYLVRPFYQGNGWTPILRTLATEQPALAQIHCSRLQEQMELVNNGIDLAQLRAALASFSAIQEVKLLRLQDEADEHLLDFIRDHSFTNGTSNLENSTRFDWESACSRAVTNLGISLLDSQCPSIRFIGPQISPEATLQLLQAPSTTLAAMGPRLTSLDITFHSSVDISPTMSDLSDVFYNFFLEAKNLVAIHIGFPTKHPISLPLNSIFHNIRWKTLRSLSIQGWRLTSEDLISLIRRHHHQLRDLHLSSIYLQSGKWSSVLNVLRHEMDHLDRLHLRGIDYAAHFDEVSFATGVEVFDPIPLPPSSSSSVSVATGPSPPSSPDLVPSLPVALLRYHRVPHRRDSLEKVWGLSVDELGDDGIHVRPDQEWFWEAWVLASRWEDGEGFGHDFSISGNANGNGNGFVKSNENRVGSH